MMEKRIKAINTLDLDFESIRGEVRENLETTFAEAQAAKQKKMPYMRAIRAVCYTLCVCMAAGILTFTINETNFWSLVTPPSPTPLPSDETETFKGEETNSPESESKNNSTEDETTEFPPSHDIDPGRYPDVVDSFDTFFAFCSNNARMVHSNIILNSDILTNEDKEIFKKYDEEQVQHYYNFYMGISDGHDIIKIYHMTEPFDAFCFNSGLDYRFEDVISEFESMSETELTKEYLSGHQSTTDSGRYTNVYDEGIFTFFKQDGAKYVTYYQCKINNKVYVVNTSETNSESSGKPIGNNPTEVEDYKKSYEKNEQIVETFDKFFAFGSESPTTGISFYTIYNSMLLSSEDKRLFEQDLENRVLQLGGLFNVYLGVINGVDTVILTYVNDPSIILTYKSALDYSFEDVISEFEMMSGEKLDKDFLSSSNYDYNQLFEKNGIILCFKEEIYTEETVEEYVCVPYYKAEIQGQIYIVNK